MRLALAQLNPLIGDLQGNAERILQAGIQAAEAGAELLLTPELSLWGYPPRDLLLRPALVQQQRLVLQELSRALPAGLQALVGLADPVPAGEIPRLWNALALLNGGGDWQVVARKRLLPSYDVFDETRYFLPGRDAALLELEAGARRWRLGLSICEDLWVEQDLQDRRMAGVDPIGELAALRLDLLLNLSASPYGRGKLALRRRLAARAAQRTGCSVLYLNQVGGNDELVFDGGSFGVGVDGTPLWQAASDREQLILWDAMHPHRPAVDLGLSSGSDQHPGAAVPCSDAATTTSDRSETQPRKTQPCKAQTGAAQQTSEATEHKSMVIQAMVIQAAQEPLNRDHNHERSHERGHEHSHERSHGRGDSGAAQAEDSDRNLQSAEQRAIADLPDEHEQLLRALVLGVRDYARKCGFSKALLGLSGGIDSALVAVIACAALGSERVSALRLPSPWSSQGSLDDAADLAERLRLPIRTLPIASLMQTYDRDLTAVLDQPPIGVTAENLQSRIRGTVLMALANQTGALLLSTGNKSELAVGYCTLYGDMNGGLAVIGDLYKTTVFSLCNWIDSEASCTCRRDLGLPHSGDLIGREIRCKPPSAELRPDQKDSDSLPDYTILDAVLRRYIETMATPEQLIAEGADRDLAQRVFQLLRKAEFKRRQAAPVLKISSRSFGGGWRMPIAAGV